MFDHRAYMLDISRDKVPTMSTLRILVELLARFGYNQLQLYIEHTLILQDKRQPVYAALTGDQVALTDIRIR